MKKEEAGSSLTDPWRNSWTDWGAKRGEAVGYSLSWHSFYIPINGSALFPNCARRIVELIGYSLHLP